MRFERTGSTEDLDRAIIINEQALESTSQSQHIRMGVLNNLGLALQSRFDRTGSMEDLDRAIVANEQVVELTTDENPARVMYLNNLMSALQRRFVRTGSMDDLKRAIVTNEQAIESTPEGHPDRAMFLNNLGIALQRRFKRTGSMDDLDRAIMTNEQAVESTSGDHTAHTMYLNNLTHALLTRFERTGSIEDQDRAIVIIAQVVESTPDGHPDRAMFLINLGGALHMRFQRTGSMDDLNSAIARMEEALNSDTAPPFIRLKAASSCSDLLIHQRSYQRAKFILQAAVHLLPMISPRTLKRSDQQHNISQFVNITSRAVSLYLEDAEDAYPSLQLLELGRGIIANLQLEVRSDISVLEASHPDLAKQFRELRDRIDPPSRTFDSSIIVDSSVTLRFIFHSRFVKIHCRPPCTGQAVR